MLRKTWTVAMTGVAIAFFSGAATAKELAIFWAEWDPANYLQELVNDYTTETGVEVTVETTPWADFMTKTFTELNAHGHAFDLVIGDSQWLGEATSGGHYVDLTAFVNEHRLTEVMAPAAMSYYSEYPRGSGRYWSVPLEGDAVGWAYRKDWFEDPSEKQAFEKRYGYELAAPSTWKQMRDIAEFFYRPDEHRYGIAIYDYLGIESLAMGFENALFSFGGDLGDYRTCEAEGIINSRRAIEALEAYRELYGFAPPHWAGNGFQEKEDNRAITEGLTAMSMNFFAFFPSLTNPKVNPHAAVTGFFENPAGPYGDKFSALGGQGISIVSYSQNQEEAKEFLAWFIRDDVQKKWAAIGGLTTHVKTLQSPEFRNATPYNEAFYQSMFVLKDFWAVPSYATLLDQLNKSLGPYMVEGKGTAKEALDDLARDWDTTLRQDRCN